MTVLWGKTRTADSVGVQGVPIASAKSVVKSTRECKKDRKVLGCGVQAAFRRNMAIRFLTMRTLCSDAFHDGGTKLYPQFRFFLLVLLLVFLNGCSSPSAVVAHRTVKSKSSNAEEFDSDWNARGTTLNGRDMPESPVSHLPPISALAKAPPVPPDNIKSPPVPIDATKSPTVPVDSVKSPTIPTDGVITIQPDCLVQIKVRDDPILDGNYSVNEIGAVELGYVGPVILLNMTEPLAKRKIKEVLDARYFRDAAVEVRISKPAYDRIEIGGAVNKPGLVRIGAGDSISLNDALLRAGGLKPSAKGATVRIV